MTVMAPDKSTVIEKGGCRFGARLFFCLAIALSAPFAQAANELNSLRELAAAGAPQLALLRIDSLQPPLADDLRGWIRWERVRLQLLAENGRWRALEERASALPEATPRGFARWVAGYRAEALLALAEAGRARSVLRDLIWSGEGDAEALAHWRRQLIRAYLLEGRRADAYTALLRYSADYGEGDAGESLLRARVLLSQGRYAEAQSRLEGLAAAPERDALLRLARLRGGEKRLFKAMRSAAEAQDEQADARLYGLLWGSTAEAAASEPGLQLVALERLFSRRGVLEGQRDLFDINADTLWQAYFGYAERNGNSRQLLFGDDAAWFALAAEEPRLYPVRSHSLYALMAERATTAEAREQAHAQLAEALLATEGGIELLRHLYLGSKRFGSPEALPAVIRQALVDSVIAEGDLVLAARLLSGLEQAPPTVDAFLWELRRAKVFILAGDHSQAEMVLRGLIASPAVAEPKQRDRLIQLLFDLQSVERHELAYSLLQALMLRSADPQLRRELLFWMADSRKAQSQSLEAARLYLESATLPGSGAMDPWAQTARYQAARSLAEAGLLEDAAGLYRMLLAATEDPARRAVLRRELEQLALRGR